MEPKIARVGGRPLSRCQLVSALSYIHWNFTPRHCPTIFATQSLCPTLEGPTWVCCFPHAPSETTLVCHHPHSLAWGCSQCQLVVGHLHLAFHLHHALESSLAECLLQLCLAFFKLGIVIARMCAALCRTRKPSPLLVPSG